MDSHVAFSEARSGARVSARSLTIKTESAYRAAVEHCSVVSAKMRLGQASAADVRNAVEEVARWERHRCAARTLEQAVSV